jgi:hypothetical protein
MVTPTYGTMTFTGGGGNIMVDLYVADVANAPVHFDSGNGASATSETFWVAPCAGHITDLSFKTGPTVIFAFGILAGGARTRSTPRLANHLNTLPFRPQLNIPVSAGEQIAMVELV